MPDTSDADLPRFSAAALQEWGGNVESVIRGIAHALNNRAAALSAVIELSRDPTGDDAEAVSSILSSELVRVSELAQVVRTIGTPRHGVEAFAPRDAATESLAVLQLQIEHRDRMVTIEAAAAPPVRAAARILIVEDSDWIVTRVEEIRAPTAEVSPYAAELARAMGGETLGTSCGFRLPSLTTLRRREAR